MSAPSFASVTVSFAFVFLGLLAAVGLASVDTHSVLLVVNDASPTSLAIGKYYQSVRCLPEVNVCHLNCTTNEQVAPEVYTDQIKAPIWNYLTSPAHPWMKDQIKVILMTKGVPLWFWADEWRDASVDMPLCYLGSESPTGAEPFGWAGRHNAYYGQEVSFEAFRGSDKNQLKVPFPELQDLCALGSGGLLAGADGRVAVQKER